MHEQLFSDPAIYIVSDRSTHILRTKDWKKNQISSSFFIHWESKVQILLCVTNLYWLQIAYLECHTKWISKSYHFLKEEIRANYKYWTTKRHWVTYRTWSILLWGKQAQSLVLWTSGKGDLPSPVCKAPSAKRIAGGLMKKTKPNQIRNWVHILPCPLPSQLHSCHNAGY